MGIGLLATCAPVPSVPLCFLSSFFVLLVCLVTRFGLGLFGCPSWSRSVWLSFLVSVYLVVGFGLGLLVFKLSLMRFSDLNQQCMVRFLENARLVAHSD